MMDDNSTIIMEGTHIDIPNTEIVYGDAIKEKDPVVYYAIHLETTEICFCLAISTVKRRFSDFIYLEKSIQKNHPLLTLPSLPSRGFLLNRYSARFIEERRTALGVFLNKLVEIRHVLSDSSLHFILQTSLTPQQIEDAIERGVTVNQTLKQGALKPFGDSVNFPTSPSTSSLLSEPPNFSTELEFCPSSSSSGEHSSS